MGAGRKAETITFSEKLSGPSYALRKLPKNCLGGAIFGCKVTTMQECLTKHLFGLPYSQFPFVANISSGLPLFLFNFTNRKMHGIYEAASNGQMNIDPYAWTDDGTERTPFPAQVCIYVKTLCLPLTEDQFKKVIEDNYYHHNHFWFELDHKQTKDLISLFKPLPVPPGIRQAVLPVTKVKPSLELACKWKVKKNQQSDYCPSDLEETGQSAEIKDTDILLSNGWMNVNVDGCSSSSALKVEEIKVQDLNVTFLNAKDQKNNSEVDASFDGESRRLLQHDSEGEDQEVEVQEMLDKLRCIYNQRPPSSSSPKHISCDSCVSCTAEGVEKETVLIEESIVDKVLEKTTICYCQESPKLVEIIEQLTQKTIRLEMKQTTSDNEIQQLRHVVNESERTIEELRNKLQGLESKHASSADSLEHEKVIYLIGGFDGNSWLAAADCFSPSRDYVESLKPMTFARSYSSAAVLDENIFVFGGGDGISWQDTVECYNQRKKVWTDCPRLNREKGSLVAVKIKDKIYVIGGGNGVECLSDVEMFDPTLGKWIATPALSRKRFAPAALEFDGIIYTVGGYDGTSYLMSAERYDPREGYWTKLPSMNTRRGCHSLAVLNQKIYAVGGYDGTAMVSSSELLDPRLSCWMPGEPMVTVRGYATTEVIDDTIYVIGGLTGEYIFDTVDCFKEGVGWTTRTFNSIKKRCFATTVVV